MVLTQSNTTNRNFGVIDVLVDFSEIMEITIPGMNNGTGTMSAKMFMDDQGKIIPCTIHTGSSIGIHQARNK